VIDFWYTNPDNPEKTNYNIQISIKDKNQQLMLILISPILIIGMSYLQDPIIRLGILNLGLVIYWFFVF
jgi:hypothetical protein